MFLPITTSIMPQRICRVNIIRIFQRFPAFGKCTSYVILTVSYSLSNCIQIEIPGAAHLPAEYNVTFLFFLSRMT